MKEKTIDSYRYVTICCALLFIGLGCGGEPSQTADRAERAKKSVSSSDGVGVETANSLVHPLFKGEFQSKSGSKKLYNGEFFAELFIVDDPSKLEGLHEPEHYNEHKAAIEKHILGNMPAGGTAHAVIITGGASADPKGVTNVQADFYLSDSKQDRINYYRNIPVVEGPTVAFPNVVIAAESYQFQIAEYTEEEKYTVHAVVRDNVRGISLNLEKGIKVKKKVSPQA